MGLLTAARFLTIFPVPAKPGAAESIGKSLPYFPVIGLVLGIILLGIQYLFSFVLPSQVTTIMLVIALVVMTGAHHIDGFIDTCDAFAVGKSREQRLAIMADTRAGAFGITGACLILIAKYAVFTSTANFPGLLLMPALARWAVTGTIVAFPSARTSGMGHQARQEAQWTHFIAATAIVLAITLLLEGIARGFILLLGLIVIIYLLAALLNRLFGGLTGDCYGALIETGEVITLILLIIINNLWTLPDINLLNLLGVR